MSMINLTSSPLVLRPSSFFYFVFLPPSSSLLLLSPLSPWSSLSLLLSSLLLPLSSPFVFRLHADQYAVVSHLQQNQQ